MMIKAVSLVKYTYKYFTFKKQLIRLKNIYLVTNFVQAYLLNSLQTHFQASKKDARFELLYRFDFDKCRKYTGCSHIHS